MIVTVSLNPALDLTYRLPRIRRLTTNRVQGVDRRAGGKAINVARLLRAFDQPVAVTGFAGGVVGEEVRAALAAAGIADALVPVTGESRHTVTVVEPGGATVFAEPGAAVTDADWNSLVKRVSILCADADAVVLSGSLPPGVPPDVYAVLARRATAAGVPVLLDADGPALVRGVAGRPTIAKPNLDELQRATGETEPIAGAEALQRAGAQSVVVSLGANGMIACTPEGRWRATATPLDGNPTGAGDAAVAALAVGVVTGQPWPVRLAHATAASAAAVLSPTAGEIDHATYQRLLSTIKVHAEGAPCLS